MRSRPHVIVTGAAGGIGSQLVADLLEVDYAVTGLDVNEATLRALRERFPSVTTHALDLTDSVAVTSVIERAAAELGPPHGLINVAGDNRMKPLAEITDDDWQHLIATNLSSTFYACRAVAPLMRTAGGGRIVNTASIFGMRGVDADSAYAAAKAGVIGLTRALATELARDGITANAVSPVVVLTDRVRMLDPDHLAGQLGRIPLGRFSDATDVTHTMRFLLSESGSFYTGQTFSPNGGDLMP